MKKITLEMSLKPFKKTDSDYIRNVCRKMFLQWMPLLKEVNEIKVMLWTADGSEILDYSGNPDDKFEWCCYLGTANLALAGKQDRPDLSLHQKKRFYTDNPPVMTYRILKNIVNILKEEGSKIFPDSIIRVGNTFDIGPEFAVSDFKYNRHREICSGTKLDRCGFIDSTSHLNGDNHKYAAYPDGIPDNTPFGLFLGKQSDIFLRDMGFDFLWLSNGLGFSAEPWALTGKVYDGNKFYPDNLKKLKSEVFEFWKYFRQGCPDYPLETRGTNNSAGIDYATDGVPLYEIYNGGFDITPPPNSPWAALNGDYGLELMGHMSRICELPGDNFIFRYYIHDPWWVNSPWYDRYQGYPHDIYLPMAVSRITKTGSVQSAEQLNILSVDNSYGDMPDCCVNEPLPHILKAIKDKSDEIPPLVWIYPLREFTSCTSESDLNEMYFGDSFIKDSINTGLPLNCVVSTDNFCIHSLDLYKKSIIISPIPLSSNVLDKLNTAAEAGIPVIVYGTGERLNSIALNKKIVKAPLSEACLPDLLRIFGYNLTWSGEITSYKHAMTINRSDNAFIFSVYNTDTTKDCSMKFPLGAPILMNCETELSNGYSIYRFARSEHKECRIFIEQNSGYISATEHVSVNDYIRRQIKLCGLSNATICFFPEKYCIGHTMVSSGNIQDWETPVYISGDEWDKNWSWENDEKGTYLKGTNISGDIIFYMPRAKYIK